MLCVLSVTASVFKETARVAEYKASGSRILTAYFCLYTPMATNKCSIIMFTCRSESALVIIRFNDCFTTLLVFCSVNLSTDINSSTQFILADASLNTSKKVNTLSNLGFSQYNLALYINTNTFICQLYFVVSLKRMWKASVLKKNQGNGILAEEIFGRSFNFTYLSVSQIPSYILIYFLLVPIMLCNRSATTIEFDY